MAFLLTFVLSSATLAHLTGDEPVRIAPVRIVDLEAGRVVPDRALLVRDGRIAAVTAAGGPLPDGVRALDGKNRSALPGLIDAHVHLNDPEREARLMVAPVAVAANGRDARFAARRQRGSVGGSKRSRAAR